ncbi:MAG: PKD domain-containing protein [Paludibacter sp.]
MSNKTSVIAFLSLIIIGFSGCSDAINTDFTYSPVAPKAGETVTFTNSSSGGDSWSWSFGDDYSSTTESPTHTFTKAGTYTVVLKVNSNNNYVKTKQIIIYDTIPTIEMNVGQVDYYSFVTFNAVIYNPNSYAVSYNWTFSSNAHGDSIVNNVSTAIKPKLFFSKKNVTEIVKLTVTIGDSIYNVADTITVHDVKVASLLMAEKDGQILRQRIFTNGFEDYTSTGISSGKHPFNMSSSLNYAYIFDAGSKITYQNDWLTNTSGDGNIRAINLTTDKDEEVINNKGLSTHFGFFNGSVDNNYIYWTDYSELLYKIAIDQRNKTLTWNGSVDAQNTAPFYLAKVNSIGYYGNGMASDQFSGGINCYDDIYFWAKGGSGAGMYRFEESDINSGIIPSLGAILTGYSIRAFSIDKINQKIYFSVTAPSEKVGFWVADINGSNAKRIDDAPMDNSLEYITGIVVNNASDKVYWAYRCPDSLSANTAYMENHPTHRTGVKQARLAKLYTNAGEIEYFALGVSVYGLALDEIEK